MYPNAYARNNNLQPFMPIHSFQTRLSAQPTVCSNINHTLTHVRRNLECGVPVVVLSRSHTGQHVYRWCQLLQSELAKTPQGESIDPGLLTFVSCGLEGQRRLMAALPHSPLYLTGSREVGHKSNTRSLATVARSLSSRARARLKKDARLRFPL